MQTFLCLSDQISISIQLVLISLHQIPFSVQTSNAVRPKLDSVWILARPTLLFQSITFPLEKQAARKFCLEIAFPQNILAGKSGKNLVSYFGAGRRVDRQAEHQSWHLSTVSWDKMEDGGGGGEHLHLSLQVCLEDEGGNMSCSYLIVITSQCSSLYLYPKWRMIT